MSRVSLTRAMLVLALPVLVEHLLHTGVGLTDTYLANNLVSAEGLSGEALDAALAVNSAAAAAIGTIAYVMWLLGLLTGAVGTGSTALIARATGGGRRALASAVVGQSVLAVVAASVVFAALVGVSASGVAALANLPDESRGFFVRYLYILSPAIPFAMLMFVCGACLRGAGDTLTPALAMCAVDIINIVLSVGLVYGWFGLPQIGFDGIAIGTVAGYVGGATILLLVLIRGRKGIGLYRRRLRPHAHTLRRILRIGLPSGLEGALQWGANFGVLFAVNGLGAVSAAGHVNVVRIEALSYLSGFAFATAAATLVGQSLGMGDRSRAKRSVVLTVVAGGGMMTLWGVAFVLAPGFFAGLMTSHPQTLQLTADTLRLAGFVQLPFGLAMIVGGALRGAGDTLAVMRLNLVSILTVRLLGVLIVTKLLGLDLLAVWAVLCLDLTVRGGLITARFLSGKWQQVRV